MLHDDLLASAEPALRKVIDHPFWAGLRDGSLPGEALAHFVGQDTGHLLPAYSRALARCAAVAPVDAHSVFFARSVTGTLAARDRLRAAFAELAPSIGVEPVAGEPQADPLTLAHCSFFRAAATTSLPAGVGALLPMAWFNHYVSKDLAERCVPGSVYEPWIALYQPSEGYFDHVVQRYLDIVDEVGESCSARDRVALADHFSTSVRYEWLFAESAWRRPNWPV